MKNTFTPSLLQECCVRDRAELLEVYEKTNRESIISFRCNCSISGIKKFREIVEKAGLFCTNCVKLNFKTKLRTNWDGKDKETVKRINEKRKKTMIEVLGVDNPTKSKIIQEKIKRTCLAKYGFENQFQNEEIKQKIKQKCLEKYGVEHHLQNPEVFSKLMKSSYAFKSYVTPSGKILKLRGYEHFASDTLFKIYPENEIISDSKFVPEIWYIHGGKRHRYFCDFFIKSANLIVEVKSTYTYRLEFDINLSKQQACIAAGYNFEFWIFNEKGVRL